MLCWEKEARLTKNLRYLCLSFGLLWKLSSRYTAKTRTVGLEEYTKPHEPVNNKAIRQGEAGEGRVDTSGRWNCVCKGMRHGIEENALAGLQIQSVDCTMSFWRSRGDRCSWTSPVEFWYIFVPMLRSLVFVPECPLEYYNLVAVSYQVGFVCAKEHFVITLENELERKTGKSGGREKS